MLNKKDREICDKFSKKDETNHVHCSECPLMKGDPKHYDFRCKANSSYNIELQSYDYDYHIDSTVKQIACYGETVFRINPNRSKQRARQICKVFSNGWG